MNTIYNEQVEWVSECEAFGFFNANYHQTDTSLFKVKNADTLNTSEYPNKQNSWIWLQFAVRTPHRWIEKKLPAKRRKSCENKKEARAKKNQKKKK